MTLSKNFVSYAVIISTALDSYATRYIAMEYHKRDFDKANSYVSSAFYGDTVILINIIGSVIMTVLFSFVAKAIAPSTWVGLIVTACILSIFGLGIYFIFVFSNKERKYIINMIKRKANIKQ